MSINVYNQPLYTPGTDPYCLKLFYELILINTTFTTSEDFMAFSVSVENKIATRTFRLSDMHATQTLRAHFFGEQAYLKKLTSSTRDFPTPDKRISTRDSKWHLKD